MRRELPERLLEDVIRGFFNAETEEDIARYADGPARDWASLEGRVQREWPDPFQRVTRLDEVQVRLVENDLAIARVSGEAVMSGEDPVQGRFEDVTPFSDRRVVLVARATGWAVWDLHVRGQLISSALSPVTATWEEDGIRVSVLAVALLPGATRVFVVGRNGTDETYDIKQFTLVRLLRRWPRNVWSSSVIRPRTSRLIPFLWDVTMPRTTRKLGVALEVGPLAGSGRSSMFQLVVPLGTYRDEITRRGQAAAAVTARPGRGCCRGRSLFRRGPTSRTSWLRCHGHPSPST